MGDYHVLPQEGGGRARALVRNGQGQVELISNVCRHRQALRAYRNGQVPTRGAIWLSL